MTETELHGIITTNGWTILQTKVTGQEANITHKAVAASKEQDNVLDRQWIHYYLYDDGTCFWAERDPFPPIVEKVPSFREKVEDKIKALVAANTIKAAYIERVNDVSKTALVVAVGTDNAYKPYHVWEDSSEVIQVIALTGTYPIG